MVVLDGLDAAVEVDERMAVRRQHPLHVRELVHAVEGGEELGEGIGRRRETRDVRGDRGQDVVAGQDETGRGIEEAQVVGCVPGRVEGHPLASGELDDVGVVEAPGRGGGADGFAQAGEVQHALLASPLVVEAGTAPRRGPEGRHLRLDLGIDIAGLGRIPPGREAAVADDLGPGLGAEPARPAEVVRVAVGDDNGVHPPQWQVGLGQAVIESGPRLGPRQAGVDQRDAPLVLEGVAVHVPEPGHRDGELEPQDTRADLGHRGRRRLLLLAERGRSHAAQDNSAMQLLASGRAGDRDVIWPSCWPGWISR